MKNTILRFLLYGVCTFVCAQQNDIEDAAIKETWQQFLSVVAQEDTNAFRQMVGTTIYCYMCLENTPEEYEYLNALRESDTDWYDRVYTELIYIPRDTFVKQDLKLIFTPDFLTLLKKNKTVFVSRMIEGKQAYEVLVTTTLPTAVHEGGQHSFQFVKQEQDYIFTMISTIP